MERNARRFVLRILGFHLLLLAMVVGTVYLASREIYQSARRQAIEQAKRRQELLASQTARGLESFYASIFAAMDLLQRASIDSPESRAKFAQAIWEQLEGPVSQLILVDQDTLRVERSFNQSETLDSAAVIKEAGQWLREAKEPSIRAIQFGPERGQDATIACVPVTRPQGPTQLIVAVMPMRGITARFLTDVNNQRSMNAMLLDENARIMGADDPTVIGKTVIDKGVDPRIATAALEFLQQGKPGTKVFEEPFTLDENIYNSAMTSLNPIDVAQKKWWLALSSSFAEVDEVVQTLFRRALIWGIFVIVSATAILLSTSVQLIRGRLRLERERHEMLARELSQAREIQLAWLPKQSEFQSIDIAAVNQPASHISGDFYNWFELPDGRTVVTIGDVTGHGIAAAFLMATTQLLVKTTMLRLSDPGQCLDEVNRQLCVQVFNGQFVTMLIVVIDLSSNTIELATAGHQPPLISRDGAFTPLPVQPQLVLGVDEDVAFPTERFPITPQTGLLLYTDGAVDVQSPGGERFSTESLQQEIGGHFSDATQIIDVALAAVNTFRGERELADDLTFVAIQLQTSHVPEIPAAAAT